MIGEKVFFLQKISKKNYYEIKYEDLINNNIQIINQLLDFLLVDKKATKYNGNTFTSLIPSVENKIHKNINKDFIKENIEKWKIKLSTKRNFIFRKVLQNEMLYKGYNVNNESNELVFMFYIEIIKVKLILFLARIKRIFNGLFKNNRFYLIKLLSKIKYLILKNKSMKIILLIGGSYGIARYGLELAKALSNLNKLLLIIPNGVLDNKELMPYKDSIKLKHLKYFNKILFNFHYQYKILNKINEW